MVIKIFSNYGMAVILISLLLGLFCIEGCLERAAGPAQEPSSALEGQVTDSGFQMDYDVELSSDLFRVKGDLAVHRERPAAVYLGQCHTWAG
jgi:hypothetical protein